MTRLIRWLFRLKPYTFEHDRGARHTVWARSRGGAWRQMAWFLCGHMFGEWALVYDPRALAEELTRIRLVSSPEDPKNDAAPVFRRAAEEDA